MPANDELPRGWVLATRTAVGAQASIAVPAVPGVAHVLTDVQGSIIGVAGVVALVDVIAQLVGVFDTAHNNPLFDLSSGAMADHVQISGSWTGKSVGAVGAALTVNFNAAVANLVESLVIQGYDV